MPMLCFHKCNARYLWIKLSDYAHSHKWKISSVHSHLVLFNLIPSRYFIEF